ncbi:MAG: type II toxin-antitoxin system PemK/MazF family toxin [Betaproteobacteria bacterium]|nr:type II toxin-antitoxin system PemK/MazF family toxin [Betaproteobacteria bacterium]
MSGSVKRFDIWLVDLDPTKGREIYKTRSCVVISPDENSLHYYHTHSLNIAPVGGI